MKLRQTMITEPTYLGDSVYARPWPPNGVVIYLDNGHGPHTEIYLEPSVIAGLLVALRNKDQKD